MSQKKEIPKKANIIESVSIEIEHDGFLITESYPSKFEEEKKIRLFKEFKVDPKKSEGWSKFMSIEDDKI